MEEYTLDGVQKRPLVILGYVSFALKKERLRDLVMKYRTEALKGDMSHLLCVSKEYLAIANKAAETRKK